MVLRILWSKWQEEMKGIIFIVYYLCMRNALPDHGLGVFKKINKIKKREKIGTEWFYFQNHNFIKVRWALFVIMGSWKRRA